MSSATRALGIALRGLGFTLAFAFMPASSVRRHSSVGGASKEREMDVFLRVYAFQVQRT